MLRTAAHLTSSVAFVAYPILIYVGIRHDALRLASLAAVVLLVPALALRAWAKKPSTASVDQSGQATEGPARADALSVVATLGWIPLVTVGLLTLSAALNHEGLALYTPVAINTVFLGIFGATLRSDRPMIERFARLQEPDLPPIKQRWCRSWTIAWCAYFFLNATITLGLALWAPPKWWALHTSLIAYIAMGLLFAGERAGRWLRFERHSTLPTAPGPRS